MKMKLKKWVKNLFALSILLFVLAALIGTMGKTSVFADRNGPAAVERVDSGAAAETTWLTVSDHVNYRNVNDLIQAANGDLLVIGSDTTDTFNAVTENWDLDAWVARFDLLGNLLWQYHIGTDENDYGEAVVETAGGDVVIAGTGGAGGWIAALDTDGNLKWQQSHPTINYRDITLTADEGFVATGSTSASGAGGSDIIVVKMNSLGVVEWQKTYGTASWETGGIVVQTLDLGYVVASEGGWLIKLNSEGVIQWQKRHNEGSSDTAEVVELSDGNLIVAAGVHTGWVAKMDADGNLVWKRILTNISGGSLQSIQPAADGGFVAAGKFYNATSSDALILKFDESGVITWQKGVVIPGSQDDQFQKITVIDDGSIAAVGSTYFPLSDEDFITNLFIARFDGAGNISRCPIVSETSAVFQDGNATTDLDLATAVSTPNLGTATLSVTTAALPMRGVCPLPEIAVSKSGPLEAGNGCPITYTLMITNNIETDLTGIVITDTVPAEADYLHGGDLVGTVVNWTVPLLPAGTTITRTFAVRASEDIINDDYRVSASEGVSHTGQIPVATTIHNDSFLPMGMKEYCGSFLDTYNDQETGWYVGDNPYVMTEYLQGEYRVLTKDPRFIYIFSAPGCWRDTYRASVDVRWHQYAGELYGMLVGVDPVRESYYFFVVNSSTLSYALLEQDENGRTALIDYSVSSSINPGTGVNHLEAEYRLSTSEGGFLTLRINGETVESNKYLYYLISPTAAGLVVEPFWLAPEADARFDNFFITTLPAAASGLDAAAYHPDSADRTNSRMMMADGILQE